MAAPKLATIENLKVPPHSIEGEQAVLGGLLLSAQAWDRVADIISESDFYREDHRLIFRAIHELSDHYGGGYGVIHLWTIICLALGIPGENEREYLRPDLKDVAVYGA